MIGSLIGAGLGAAASIIGGIKARRAAAKANRMLEQQQKDNQAWYDRKYNEDATQRADAQRMLTMTMDRIRRRRKQAEMTGAVMGIDPAKLYDTDEGINEYAEVAGRIAADGAARKDQVENQYLAQKNALTQQQIGVQQQQAGNIAQATQGASQALMGAGAAVDELGEAEKNRELIKELYKNNSHGS